MSSDPRQALSALVTAFERHLEASAGRTGPNDPAVASAYEAIIDAFEAYDDALLDAYGEITPLDVYDDDEDDEGDDDEDDEDDEDQDDDGGDEDDDDDDEEDDLEYVGLDSEDYDVETRP